MHGLLTLLQGVTARDSLGYMALTLLQGGQSKRWFGVHGLLTLLQGGQSKGWFGVHGLLTLLQGDQSK